MSDLSALLKCGGDWSGEQKITDHEMNIMIESSSTAQINSVFNGKFVSLFLGWSNDKDQHFGRMLIGYNPKTEVATINWIDSWHMQPDMLHSTGSIDAQGVISVKGMYSAGSGPDWGWRTIITPGEENLRIEMINVTPDGQEAPAVDMNFTKIDSSAK